MLYPKKVKYRKWQTGRKNLKRARVETRGAKLAFGSHGLKASTHGRITAQQLEAARKTMSRAIKKVGKVWVRVFPDRPFTQKPAEVKMGKGKGDIAGYCVEVKPGRILFEIDGIPGSEARDALRKAGSKVSVRTIVIERSH